MVLVAFVHPDLGIGGAEKLICDASLALQKRGHKVKIFTSHHDKNHCFSETINGTLSVKAVGDWLPRHFCWKFYAFFAYIRMIYVALYLIFFSHYHPDIIVSDQISACLPILKLRKKAKLIFYCHFPDMLLTQRKSILKKIYRTPIDWLEEKTTGLADIVMVNSQYTAQTFFRTFTSLRHIKPIVLYPSLNFDAFTQVDDISTNTIKDIIPSNAEYIFLSINRYERKKNLDLAIYALKELKEMSDEDTREKIHLVVAGGYDDRVDENKEHYEELQRLASDLSVTENITFLRSFSDTEKIFLLSSSTCLIYTPSNEHFGIVPIEAMFMKLPVIACKSGGPLETVEHEVTGYLCDPTAKEFANAMLKFTETPLLKSTLGGAGHARVVNHFSFDSFANRLDATVNELASSNTKSACLTTWIFALFIFLVICVALFLCCISMLV